jgi:hypothetical protein
VEHLCGQGDAQLDHTARLPIDLLVARAFSFSPWPPRWSSGRLAFGEPAVETFSQLANVAAGGRSNDKEQSLERKIRWQEGASGAIRHDA